MHHEMILLISQIQNWDSKRKADYRVKPFRHHKIGSLYDQNHMPNF